MAKQAPINAIDKNAMTDNKNLIAVIDRIRGIPPDGIAICTNGRVPFIFELVMNGCEMLKESREAYIKNKTITIPNRTTAITKYIFDYIQYGDRPDSTVSIKTLVNIYSMADEYRIVELYKFTKGLLKAKVNEYATQIYTYVTDPNLADDREAAYIVIRNNIRGKPYFYCETCNGNITLKCQSRISDKYCEHSIKPEYFSIGVKICPECSIPIRMGLSQYQHNNKNYSHCSGKIIIKYQTTDVDSIPRKVQAELFARIASDPRF